MLLWKTWKIKIRILYWVYGKADGTGDEGISVKGSSATEELKKWKKTFAVQSCIGGKGSLIIEEERRLHVLKSWEIRTKRVSYTTGG